jgi:hypothetical protein
MAIRIEDQAASGIMNQGEQAKVMLLGTFHFANPGLDELNLNVDMMTDRRQAEIEEVVRLLEAFRPTKIAVEAPLDAGERLRERFSAYQSGEFDLPANEVYQLGFRLAGSVDAQARHCETEEALTAYLQEHGIAEDNSRDQIIDRKWWDRFTDLWRHAEQLIGTKPLREYLAFINSEEHIRLNHGINLAWPDAEAGDYHVVDFVTGWWYNRNLRILAYLKRISESPADRILVICGSSHVPILQHCVETSYLHKLVPVSSYL